MQVKRTAPASECRYDYFDKRLSQLDLKSHGCVNELIAGWGGWWPWVVGGWVGTIRVHCEARDPCHAPQISHPIPRAERFLPTCVHHRHIPSCVCQAREIANASHIETRMSITHCHEWRINLCCSDTLPAHHHGHHTFRMWWASSVASLSHSNRLSNFDRVPPVTLSGGIDHEWGPAV